MNDLVTISIKGIELVMVNFPKLALVIFTLFIVLWVIKDIFRLMNKSLEETKVDAILTPFLCNMASWGLRLMSLISVESMVGIATTSFIVVLGAAGLAIGLALQGSLAHFAVE